MFSGSGDVYLTSSKAGGKIVIEGISAAYTGTIYCDISCEASFGDLSKATNCNINVSDVILSRSSGDIGNLTIGLGATLEVTVTKADLIEGLEIGSVTLNDGATMVLKDKTGKELVTFAAADAVDGKYVLAPDPNVTVECLLDYEFNGNMISVGTDTTGLNIWNGTASYDSQSEKIYMRCKPYINTTFAMPDDEWSVFMRCTAPAANSANPTMMLMFGKNGGNVFGLVAGTGENTVALASKDGLIGEAVQEITDKKIILSEGAQKELKVLEKAVTDISEMAIKAFIENDNFVAFQIDPLEEVIDDLCDRIKNHHIERVSRKECSLETGFVFNDLLTDYERISDHCSNIAVDVIESEQGLFGQHQYHQILNEAQDEAFHTYFDDFKKEYSLD